MQGEICMMMHHVAMTQKRKRTNNYLIGEFSGSLQCPSDDFDDAYIELDDDFIAEAHATRDAKAVKELLARRVVRYKLSPNPKFAASPIDIRDKDYDLSLDLSYISIVEKEPFCGTENESAMDHMNELSTLSNLFSDDIKLRTYFVAEIWSICSPVCDSSDCPSGILFSRVFLEYFSSIGDR
jgi:hypothetical protein